MRWLCWPFLSLEMRFARFLTSPIRAFCHNSCDMVSSGYDRVKSLAFFSSICNSNIMRGKMKIHNKNEAETFYYVCTLFFFPDGRICECTVMTEIKLSNFDLRYKNKGGSAVNDKDRI